MVDPNLVPRFSYLTAPWRSWERGWVDPAFQTSPRGVCVKRWGPKLGQIGRLFLYRFIPKWSGAGWVF